MARSTRTVPTEPTRARFRRTFEAALGVPFSRGNRVVPLRNGARIFPEMLEAIRGARRSVEFETFVYWRGEVARKFADALAAAAGRGVRVRVLLDAVGCTPMSDDIRTTLENSGADVQDFGPVRPFKPWRIDQRTHRKILVCDAEFGFTGGVGIAEEWEGDARGPDEWRETHFRICGPAVRGLRASFFQHWLATEGGRDALPAEDPEPTRGPDDEPVDFRCGDGDGCEVQVIRSTASGRWTDIQTLFRTLIVSAEERLRITTAYFVPDPRLVCLLVDAAGRGVDVEIMHPGPHTDHRVCQLAGEETYDDLLEAGVRIWRYQPTMLHPKVITADGMLSCVGSANLNHRSLMKDDEVAVVILDPELAAVLERDFENDRERCEEVTDAGWARRSWRQKTAESVARLFRREL